MIREYKTIEEVAGPLMLVRQVDGVKYDELGEIQLPNGDVRRCRVLEVNGRDVLVQLFESSAGINLADSKVRFLGHGIEFGVSDDILGRVFSGMGTPIDGGPAIIPEQNLDITAHLSTPPHVTIRRNLSRRAFRPSTVLTLLFADRSFPSSRVRVCPTQTLRHRSRVRQRCAAPTPSLR
jgi:vacuolar-type H+-ATPase subunit B/Vma2